MGEARACVSGVGGAAPSSSQAKAAHPEPDARSPSPQLFAELHRSRESAFLLRCLKATMTKARGGTWLWCWPVLLLQAEPESGKGEGRWGMAVPPGLPGVWPPQLPWGRRPRCVPWDLVVSQVCQQWPFPTLLKLPSPKSIDGLMRNGFRGRQFCPGSLLKWA